MTFDEYNKIALGIEAKKEAEIERIEALIEGLRSSIQSARDSAEKEKRAAFEEYEKTVLYEKEKAIDEALKSVQKIVDQNSTGAGIDLSKLYSKKQLQDISRLVKLPVSGTEAVIVVRLIAHFGTAQAVVDFAKANKI